MSHSENGKDLPVDLSVKHLDLVSDRVLLLLQEVLQPRNGVRVLPLELAQLTFQTPYCFS